MSVGRVMVFGVVMVAALGCSASRQRVDYRYAGHDQATMTDVNVVPGPMPANESFTGSFSSPQIGDVFLEQTGDSVVGQYSYPRGACRATGRIEGRVEGNLLRFSWTESQRSCGRLGLLRGKGYFLFWVDSAGNGRANGQWGFNDNETGGGPWSLFRDRVRRQPPAEEHNNDGAFSDDPVSGGADAGASGN
ncbi:MAG: hypothetical protein R3A52_25480 [Polyangiales bacterium]